MVFSPLIVNLVVIMVKNFYMNCRIFDDKGLACWARFARFIEIGLFAFAVRGKSQFYKGECKKQLGKL